MSRCRDCRMPIKFVHPETRADAKPLPVDPVPDDGGNVSARVVQGRLVGRVLRRGEDDPTGWQRFMPHHATCAVRSRGRKGKRRPTPPPTLFDLTEGNSST